MTACEVDKCDDVHVFDDAYVPEDDLEEECGLMSDGTCMLAGTEHCDWDCGRLAAERIAAMKETSLETEELRP